jgi:glycosyltransferase involved in cell wall biosynthesis
MEKIHVLHALSTSRLSGAEKIAAQICRNLDRDAFDVSILCNGGELLRRYRDEGLDPFDVNVNRLYPWNVARFLAIARTRRIDIVHAHGSRASLFALVCRPLAGRRYMIVSHMHGCRKWQTGKGVLGAVDRYFANRYDMNVVCGTGVYDYLMTEGRHPDPSRVAVVSNALEIEDGTGNGAGAGRRGGATAGSSGAGAADEGAAEHDFVFGFIGRLSKPKGLVPFFSKLIENGDVLDGARLVLVGDGEEMETLRRTAAGSALAERIVFEGYREDALDRLRGFDALVLPSISEGLPMAVLEAMAAEKPVLAFGVGSVGEAVRDGVNGYLVAPGDYDAFLGRMREMKIGRDTLAAMGRSGRALLEAEFGIERYVARIEAIYRSLVRGARGEGTPP